MAAAAMREVISRLTRYLAVKRLSRDADGLVNTAFTSKPKASVSCPRAKLWCAYRVPNLCHPDIS